MAVSVEYWFDYGGTLVSDGLRFVAAARCLQVDNGMLAGRCGPAVTLEVPGAVHGYRDQAVDDVVRVIASEDQRPTWRTKLFGPDSQAAFASLIIPAPGISARARVGMRLRVQCQIHENMEDGYQDDVFVTLHEAQSEVWRTQLTNRDVQNVAW